MKKTNYLYLLLFILTSGITYGQQSNKLTLESEYLSKKTINLTKESAYYTGSPYYNTQFSNGHIYKNGKLLAANKKVRYNAYKDFFEIKNEINTSNNIVNTITRNSNLSIKIGIQEFKFFRPSEKNSVYGYLLVLLNSNNLSLYKKIKKKFTPEQQATSSMDTNIPAYYKEYSILYIANEDGTFMEVPKSKKRKIELFSKYKKEINNYIKTKKINLKKEKDFIKLIKFYNSLNS